MSIVNMTEDTTQRAVTPPHPNPALADRLVGKTTDAGHAPFRSSPLAGDGGQRAVSPHHDPVTGRGPSPGSTSSGGGSTPVPVAGGGATPASAVRPRAYSHKRSETLPSLSVLGPPPGVPTPAAGGGAAPAPPPGFGGAPTPAAKPRFRPSHAKSASLSGSGVAGLFGGQGATAVAQAAERPSHLRHVRNRSGGGSFGSASDASGRFNWRENTQQGKELLARANGAEGDGDSGGASTPEPRPRTTRNRSLSLVGADAAASVGAVSMMTGAGAGGQGANAMPGQPRSSLVSNFIKSHSRPRAISLGFVNPSDYEDGAAESISGGEYFYYDEQEMAGISDQHQVPSRSLWVGNLPAEITSTDLMQIFKDYGVIESLRLLPERDCAFINYVTTEEALRARDDVRGAKIGGNPIKVGFGKADGYTQEVQMNPTRALWVGNISANTTPQLLHSVFSPFGAIESARVLTHKNCGFVNFNNEEDAARAKTVMNGQEIAGAIVRIGFAKVPTKEESTGTGSFSGAAGMMNASVGIPGSALANAANLQHTTTPSFSFPANKVVQSQSTPVLTTINPKVANENWRATAHPNITPVVGTSKEAEAADAQARGQSAMDVVKREDASLVETIAGADTNAPQGEYTLNIPPLPEAGSRRIDQSRLRELRKKLDGHPTPKEVELAYNELIIDIVELSFDYIGNTVAQKLMEKGTEPMKQRMIELIGPYIASIGVHKNGTWAVQKMIDTAKTPQQMDLICKFVAPFTPGLMLDQFGNYVVQCCLRLGTTRNQFIFDAMHDCCWDVAQGRFGARAMRTCLESQYTTKRQQKHVSISIVQNALQLCTNPNGALLITWLLDSSSLPGRFRVLAPRLAPHIAQLCIHKLASITILKIINQQVEPDARDVILQAMFFGEDNVLEEILGDQIHGVGVVHKILASPCVSEAEKPRIAERVKFILGKLQVSQVQGYRRLMDELGLVLMTAGPSMMDVSGASMERGMSVASQSEPPSRGPSSRSGTFASIPSFPPPRDPASQLALNYGYPGTMPSLVSPLDATFPTNALNPQAAAQSAGNNPPNPNLPMSTLPGAFPPPAMFGAMMQQAALAAAVAQQQQQQQQGGSPAVSPGGGPTSPTASAPLSPSTSTTGFPGASPGGFAAPGMFNPMFNPMFMMNPQASMQMMQSPAFLAQMQQQMQQMQQLMAQMALASGQGGAPVMPGLAMPSTSETNQTPSSNTDASKEDASK